MRRFATPLALLAFAILFALPATGAKKGKKNKEPEKEETPKWEVSAPPGEWRTISIDTTETTWSNVDVSPDGSTIVFDALGDIYTMPIDGGEAHALTAGIEWNYQPKYSPDGSEIVFVSDRAGGDNLWIMNADGSEPRAVTSESDHLVHNPSWSPDGKNLVGKKSFTSGRSISAGEIWMFHPGHKGGGLQLTERPHGNEDQKNQADPVFSHDGKYVFFSQDVTSGRVWQYNKDATGQIFVIQRLELATGKINRFVTGAGGAVRPTPSPDGRYLAFIKRIADLNSAIYLKDLESGKEWAIYDRFERDLQETSGTEGNAPAFAWTPDSASLVFWSGGGYHRINTETREVTGIPMHLTKEMQIRQTLRHTVDVAPESFRIKMPRWPSVSPDGSQAVFQALGVLWSKQLPDGEPQRLTSQEDHFEFFPSFSPDGRSIVYTTWDDQDQGSVRIVSASGGTSLVLTNQRGNYVEPSFSPDGDTVVFRQIGGGFMLSPMWSLETGIKTVPASGGDASLVTESGSWPRFAPDGERILFTAGSREGIELKSVDLQGFDERTHVEGSNMTEMVVSPNGEWVAFMDNYQTYIAPLMTTGKTVSLGRNSQSIPVSKVSGRAGDFLAWQDNNTLTWSRGPVLYQRSLSETFAFVDGAPDELPAPVETGIDLGFDVPLDVPQGTIAFTGARVVTMRDAMNGMEEVIENGTVVVTGNRISAVGAAGEVEVPAGAHVVDASGKTIVPGFLDAHAHGGFARNQITPQQNSSQFSNLAFGVTTIHDPSQDTSSVFSAAELQKAGKILAPRIFSTGRILYGSKGAGSHVDVDSYEEAKFHIQRMKDVGAVSVKSYQLPRRDERQMVIEAGQELGVMVVPEGGMKFQHNMNEIVDGHTTIEHSMTVKTVYDDVLQLWSQAGTAYTPTLGVSFGGMSGENYFYDRDNVWENERLMRYTPRSRVEPRAIRRPKAPDSHYNHIHVASSAKDLMRLGVPVNTGAHGQREGLATHWEMWMLAQGGFTPWEMLRAASTSGAHSLGMSEHIGSIEPGKLADLVLIDGNPLEDVRRTEFIHATMLNGRLYEAATMNQVWPQHVEREPFFWELEGGDTIHPSTLSWMEENSEQDDCRH